jgi:hypothetical protein
MSLMERISEDVIERKTSNSKFIADAGTGMLHCRVAKLEYFRSRTVSEISLSNVETDYLIAATRSRLRI